MLLGGNFYVLLPPASFCEITPPPFKIWKITDTPGSCRSDEKNHSSYTTKGPRTQAIRNGVLSEFRVFFSTVGALDLGDSKFESRLSLKLNAISYGLSAGSFSPFGYRFFLGHYCSRTRDLSPTLNSLK